MACIEPSWYTLITLWILIDAVPRLGKANCVVYVDVQKGRGFACPPAERDGHRLQAETEAFVRLVAEGGGFDLDVIIAIGKPAQANLREV